MVNMAGLISAAGRTGAAAALVTGMLAGAPGEALAADTTATVACKLETASPG
jgi:hypothetical protein